MCAKVFLVGSLALPLGPGSGLLWPRWAHVRGRGQAFFEAVCGSVYILDTGPVLHALSAACFVVRTYKFCIRSYMYKRAACSAPIDSEKCTAAPPRAGYGQTCVGSGVGCRVIVRAEARHVGVMCTTVARVSCVVAEHSKHCARCFSVASSSTRPL